MPIATKAARQAKQPQERRISVMNEARWAFGRWKRGGETESQIKTLIGTTTPDRRRIWLLFDALVKRQQRKDAPKPPPPALGRFKYSSEQFAEAERLLREGVRWRDVEERTGICRATLHRRIQYRQRVILTAEQLAAATRELEAGATWDAVAKQYGVGHSTLWKLIPWRRQHRKTEDVHDQTIEAVPV
jgi:DNA invertase Pin-like site-specific DNA recombinase